MCLKSQLVQAVSKDRESIYLVHVLRDWLHFGKQLHYASCVVNELHNDTGNSNHIIRHIPALCAGGVTSQSIREIPNIH